MPQDDQNPQTPDPREPAGGGEYPDVDPSRDGRIPDADLAPAESEVESRGEAAEDTDNQQEPFEPGAYLYDEDGNLAGGDVPYPAGGASNTVMVEPGDTPPEDEGVTAVNPYQVEPSPDEDQSYRYDYYEDSYSNTAPVAAAAAEPAGKEVAKSGGATVPPGGGSGSSDDEEDEEEEGMLRMSFMDHLEELRSRLIKIVAGLGIAFAVAVVFSPELWLIVQQPAEAALTELGVNPPNLTQIKPMEAFNVVYIKLPLIASLFLASPWILWQVWGFIAPGLYKRERKWAAPFVIVSAGLFIIGGLFAYFVAFRFGLTFLLGIGRDINITPLVSINEYFDLFVNVVLAIAIVFELPVLIFFLTLLRIVNPGFLVRNSRYAILGIVVLAAIITPTPDVFNLMIFSVPMIVLFFVGVLFSYVLVLHQEGRRFPWKVFFWTMAGLLLIAAGILAIAILYYGYRWQWSWPFLIQ